MDLDAVHHLAFELHSTNHERGQARLWGQKLCAVTPGYNSINLIPTLMPPDQYQVLLDGFTPCPEEGWITGKVGLEVNDFRCAHKPITLYVGEPTDWPSGIVRFAQPFVPAGHHRAFLGWDPEEPPGQVQGPVWSLSIRRYT